MQGFLTAATVLLKIWTFSKLDNQNRAKHGLLMSKLSDECFVGVFKSRIEKKKVKLLNFLPHF